MIPSALFPLSLSDDITTPTENDQQSTILLGVTDDKLLSDSNDRFSRFNDFEEDIGELCEEPKLGQEFISPEEAYKYYTSYAGKLGFNARKFHNRKNKNGLVCRVSFCCSRQGVRRPDKRSEDPAYRKPITRIGCMAGMACLLQKNGKYKIVSCSTTHNHELIRTPMKHMLKINRSISEAQKARTEHGDKSGCVRGYKSIGSIGQQSLLESCQQDEDNNRVVRGVAAAAAAPLVFDDEITKIRNEFDKVKQSFLNIPEALKTMPKMNTEGIYVNKNLRLDNIQVYGFDYDYTLAHYSSNLQTLIYDLAKEHIINEFNYPESCMEFKYDPTFPIRGLYYDKLKGCLLKLDFFGSIEPDGCYFGRRKLNREEIEEIYGTRHIGRDQARRFVGLMDFFCFSEACLIADMVQHFVDAKLDFDASYIYQDVNRAIQHVHCSGLVHRGILCDPQRYLVKNGQILRFLKMLRDKGKKLFLVTNSPYYFVDGGMQFMLEDSIGDKESWRELFDVVIAKANKPEFYTSEHPFRCYNEDKDTLAFSKVDAFLPNKIYYHGCLKSFLEITKWNGPEVIYFGDHLFSDLRGPSKAGWRTAAIIHELENEIRIQNDDGYRFEQAKFHVIQELLGKFHATVANSQRSDAYKSLLSELNEERQKARSVMKRMFNNSFGATFLTDTGQESAFAYHIHQYADVYTSKPENFLFYPPEAWLHVPYDIKIMPHHLKVPSSLFKNCDRVS